MLGSLSYKKVEQGHGEIHNFFLFLSGKGGYLSCITEDLDDGSFLESAIDLNVEELMAELRSGSWVPM